MDLGIKRREKYKSMTSNNPIKNRQTIKLNFDLQSLNLMCCYVLSESDQVRRSHLINMRNLFEVLDLEAYSNDMEKMKRVNFIKRGLEAKLSQGLKDPYIVIKYINGGIFDDSIIDPDNLTYMLSIDELEWINHTISYSLKYAFIYNNVDRLIDVATRFKACDYTMKKNIVEELETVIDDFKANFRKARVENRHDMTFSLGSGFDDNVKDLHDQMTAPSAKLKTGMQGLNQLFAGGPENGRCYLFFGNSGSFKSGTLLTMAYQLKKYNKDIKLKDPTKRPAIVILTMENTIKETLERLFNMSTVGDDIRNFNSDEVIELLKTTGELYLNSESPIDIIVKYKPNGSVDTGYLYTLVEELEDEGVETICLIQDYVRRIRSAYRQPDIRLELGEIINEFKVFASIKDIPVISAAQLNREASKTIETATQANKADLIRLLGRSNVGESMLMIDNIDWASLIHIEYDSAGNKYLGFNLIKIRYAKVNVSILYQPFVKNNGLKLIEDVYSNVPVFRESLRDSTPDTGLFNSGRQSGYATQRKSVDDILKSKSVLDDDNIFSNKTSYSESNSSVYTSGYVFCPFVTA